MTKRGKAFFFILPAILLIMLLTAGILRSDYLSVSPNPATIGQTVTATVTASYPAAAVGPCGVRIQFSASDPFTNIGICTSPCTITHTYSSPGSYTVTAEAPIALAVVFPPQPPSPVSVNVTVNCPAFSITTTSPLPGAVYRGPLFPADTDIGRTRTNHLRYCCWRAANRTKPEFIHRRDFRYSCSER